MRVDVLNGDEICGVVVSRKGLLEVAQLEEVPELRKGQLSVTGCVEDGLHDGTLLVFRLPGLG